MSSKKLRILKAFKVSKRAKLSQQVKKADKETIQLLTECVINVLNGIIPIEKRRIVQFEREMKLLRRKSLSYSVRCKTLSSAKGLKLLSIIIPAAVAYLG